MYDLESASHNAQVQKPSLDEFKGINYRNESLAHENHWMIDIDARRPTVPCGASSGRA